MWLAIFKNEWRSLSADKTLWLAGGLLFVVAIYGVFNGAAWTRFQAETVNAALRDEQKTFGAKRDQAAELERTHAAESFGDPRIPAYAGGAFGGGRYAFMPPAPLAALSTGQSDLYPYYFKVSLQNRDAFAGNDEIENPHNLLAGKFDPSFVIIYLLPLVILALSFNLLSGMREDGTLALTMSQPVSLLSLISGKIAARAAVVLAALILCAAFAVVLGAIDLSQAGAFPLLLLWLSAVILYAAFWFALAVLVNAWNKSSATNAVALAALWLVFVLLAPALINAAASSLYPVPSRVEMVQASRRASDAANERGGQLLGRYFQDHPDLAPKDATTNTEDFFSRFIAVQEDVARQTAPVVENFNRQINGQQQIVNRFQYLTPAVVAQTVFNDLAGTSQVRYADFQDQVEQYHKTWRGFFYPLILRQAKLSPADYERMPRFSYQPESPRAVFGRVVFGLLGLLVPALLVFTLAFVLLRRYQLAG